MDTNVSIEYLQIFQQVIYVIFEITAIVACAILVYKHKALATILMLTGAIASFITTICRTILFALVSHIDSMEIFSLLLDGVFLIQALSFAVLIIGLLLFAINYHKN